MKQNVAESYVAPEVEVVEVNVENGIATSPTHPEGPTRPEGPTPRL